MQVSELQVSGSIPVSPTSRNRPLTSENAGSGAFLIPANARTVPDGWPKLRDPGQPAQWLLHDSLTGK